MSFTCQSAVRDQIQDREEAIQQQRGSSPPLTENGVPRLSCGEIIRVGPQDDSKCEQSSARARSLLKSWLSNDQNNTFENHGYFFVFSSDGQRRYRIELGRFGNVALVDPANRALASFCIHPVIECPDENTMLVQKLMLDSDERAFLLTANWKVHDDSAHELLAAAVSNVSTRLLSSPEAPKIRRILHDAVQVVDIGSPRDAVLDRIVGQWGGVLITQLEREGGLGGDIFYRRIQERLLVLAIEFGRLVQRTRSLDWSFSDFVLRASRWLTWFKAQELNGETAETAMPSVRSPRDLHRGDHNWLEVAAETAITGSVDASMAN